MTSTFYRKPYTDEDRRNIFRDPEARTTASTSWGASGTVTLANSGSEPDTMVRFTRTDTANVRMAELRVGTALVVGTAWTVAIRIRSKVAVSLDVSLRPDTATATGAVSLGSIAVTTAWQTLVLSGTTSATAPTANAGVAFVSSSGAVADYVDIKEVLVERTATTDGIWFSGDTPSSAVDVQYRWAGAKNASASVKYVPDPVTEIMTPLLLIGPVKQTREGRSATYDYLYSQAAASSVATVGWGGPRNGEHTMIFGTGAAGRAALDFFSGYGSFVLVDDVTPWLSMAFVIDSQGCTLEQTDAVINGGVEFRPKLTVAYREIRS